MLNMVPLFSYTRHLHVLAFYGREDKGHHEGHRKDPAREVTQLHVCVGGKEAKKDNEQEEENRIMKRREAAFQHHMWWFW